MIVRVGIEDGSRKRLVRSWDPLWVPLGSERCINVLSRRDLIRSCLSLVATLATRRAAEAAPETGGVSPSLFQEYAHCAMYALSADGARLCLHDWATSDDPLRLVAIGERRTVWTTRPESGSYLAEFFAGGDSLFIEVMRDTSIERAATLLLVIDTKTGKRVEHLIPSTSPYHRDSFWPLKEGILLSARHSLNPNPYRTESLALIQLPDYGEIVRVPFSKNPRLPNPTKYGLTLSSELGPAISDDRKSLVSYFDNTLVYRKAENLEVIWTHEKIDPSLRAYRLAISAGGRSVALAITDGVAFPEKPRQFYTAIYDGDTGSETATLPINGGEGMALSPNGKLIATVEQVRSKGYVSPTIQIYDIASGIKLASLTHDSIKSDRREFLHASCQLAFTSDGKYLITSGMITKVWRL